MTKTRRIAWLGPVPTDAGAGVSYAATQLIGMLADADVQLDVFVPAAADDVAPSLVARDAVTVVGAPSGFEYDQWYSSSDMTKLVSGMYFNGRAQMRLAATIAERHRHRPYDLVYQFSHLETAALRKHRAQLPPIVLHPEVHAAGELRWHLRERRLARAGGTSLTKYAAAAGIMSLRSIAQATGVRLASRMIAPSHRFADLLSQDYRYPRDQVLVVPNPIDVDRYKPSQTGAPPHPIRILVVSRLAVRKGIDVVEALTHRLSDLAGDIVIEVIGDRSFFSDYRHLLETMDSRTSTYAGVLPGEQMAERFAAAHIILQPSYYEPFALTVGEGLASGLPVVVTDEVGAGEEVSPEVCRRVKAGDIDGTEEAVRVLVAELRDTRRREALARTARDEAERLFARSAIAPRLLNALFGDD